jgi:hypothetical protein
MESSPFTLNDIHGLQERQKAVEELEEIGNVWVSPYIAIEKATVVNPGQLIQNVGIILNQKDLPSGLDITRGALGSLDVAGRSFFAQTGIEIRFHSNSVTDGLIKDLKEGKNVSILVDITNYGQRAVELEGNIMRFFWANDRNRLRGADLLDTIKSGEFAVDGVEGEDWYLGGYESNEKFTTTGEGSDKGLCVVIRLKQEKFYIPSASEPIKKNSSMKIRDQLASLLVTVPENAELGFEIGETPKVKLSQNIVAVINTGAEQGQRHINSPLIDAGSDWTIRTETVHGLKYVEFFLYRK